MAVTKSANKPVKKTHKKGEKNSNSNGQIILGDGAYPMIPLDAINIVERPIDGSDTDQLFFNPRSIDSFEPESMTDLRESIRDNGLLQPPVVRAVYEEEVVTRIELIAGERRLRSIQMLVETDEPCFDKDSGDMVPATELYSHLPCNVQSNLDDERALRLACDENGKSKPLTIAEEIALVDRLVAMGYSQDKIAKMIGQHDSWVSHTRNFRTKLPKEGYEMLLSGRLTRNVAVQIIGYDESERDKLLGSAIEAEKKATERKLSRAQDEIDEADDAKLMAERDQRRAEERGDNSAAKKAEKAAQSAEKKKDKHKARKDKIEANAGIVTQGDLAEGARQAKVSPKKPKQLSKNDIITCVVEQINEWISEGYVDVPEETLLTIRSVAIAISEGERDPEVIVQNVMVTTGYWVLEEDAEVEEDEAILAAQSDYEADGGYEDFEEEDYDEDFDVEPDRSFDE